MVSFDRQSIGAPERIVSGGQVVKISIFKALAASRQRGYADVRESWRRFLQNCWPALGPAQRLHVTAHCQAVALLCWGMAARAGMPEAVIERVHTAGLLHDIGKCFISDELLSKHERLSDEEWRVMNRHSAAGGWLCRQLGADAATVHMVENHHNHYSRHPSGVKIGIDGPMLALGTRILTVADAFVTMCSQRSYCTAMSLGEALRELKRCEGAQFAPEAVGLVQRMYCNAA